MDLAFTPEEQAFREEIRAWVQANLPKEISHKVHNALRLTRDDLQGWAKILGKKGWLGFGWPKEFGGPGWTAVLRGAVSQRNRRPSESPPAWSSPAQWAAIPFSARRSCSVFIPGENERNRVSSSEMRTRR